MQQNRVYIFLVFLVLLPSLLIAEGKDKKNPPLSARKSVRALLPSYLDVDKCFFEAPEKYLDTLWKHIHKQANESVIDDSVSHQSSIIHLGDSHVQAGFFTDPIRSFFFSNFGYGGVGWVAPYRLAHTNSPSHYTVNSPFSGWRGANIVQRDVSSMSPGGMHVWQTQRNTISATITCKDEMYNRFNKVVVFHPTDDIGLIPAPGTTPLFKMSGGKPIANFPKLWTDTIMLQRADDNITLLVPKNTHWLGASLINGDRGAIVHTIGLNGVTFSKYNSNESAIYLKALKPNLIIISLGTNESVNRNFSYSDFSAQVRQLVRSIRKESPECKIILTSPVYSFQRVRVRRRQYAYRNNPNVAQIAKACKEVAKKEEIGFINLYKAFGGQQKGYDLVKQNVLARDRIHLNKEGYIASGNCIASALEEDYHRFLDAEKERKTIEAQEDINATDAEQIEVESLEDSDEVQREENQDEKDAMTETQKREEQKSEDQKQEN